MLAPRTGHVASVDGTGPLVGLAGDRLIAFDACRGIPCPIVAVEVVGGARSRVADAGGSAVLGGAGDGVLVYTARDGSLATLALAPGAPTGAPAGVATTLAPVRRGSASRGGEELPPGSVLLAPGGRFVGPPSAARLDPGSGVVSRLLEVLP